MEQWKTLQVNKDYEVSNQGNIRNKATGRLLKTDRLNTGYVRIKLPKVPNNGETLVHRMVAKAFCEGYAEGKHVDHIDGNKLNNCASNLRWVTVAENIQANKERGTLDTESARKQLTKVQKKAVNQLDKATGAIIATYPSMKEAEEHTGALRSKISEVCVGRRQSAGGYRWAYVDESHQETQKTVGVYCVDESGVTTRFASINEAAMFVGVNRSTLGRQFKSKDTEFSYKGYTWYKG